jgi:anti-sigma B factor antagonist
MAESNRFQIFELIGRINGSSISALVAMMDKAILGGQTDLIFDLSGVDYVNSAGLRELVQMWERVQQKGGKLQFVNPTDRVRELLEIVGLDTIFEIYDSMPQPAQNPTISRQVYHFGV